MARKPRPERVVAAGIEHHEIEPGAGAFHLAKHQADIHHLEVDVGLTGRVGADRDQEIRAAYLNAMAGIIEHRDVGALQRRPEFLHGKVERGLVQIELRPVADQGEAQAAQRRRHQRGVAAWIFQPRRRSGSSSCRLRARCVCPPGRGRQRRGRQPRRLPGKHGGETSKASNITHNQINAWIFASFSLCRKRLGRANDVVDSMAKGFV